nr:MAG TPA: hypothetical protein [Caudoviricetes sp.]DAK50875.1 MAG TPA: hypothetical protein [Caudoviricetes sp.]DAL67945.1 MAG TPA: hypothetical protein [Caudoviricetes sp.]DAM23700.1 MAG TPA: hypothetical protein [Caudoviricetes sp.]DAU37040.1 MAG TPA: hypothetical protein [Caudoviricetes sp.]
MIMAIAARTLAMMPLMTSNQSFGFIGPPFC